MIKKIFFFGIVTASILFVQITHAATLSFVSSANTASIGKTVTVSVRIDSQGQSVNAAQGTIVYPAGILQVVSINHSNSVFNIWGQEPAVNTSTGAISFLGGGTNSFTGTSLYILDVTFMVKGAGLATLDFANAGVTAGDGTGANILTGTNPLSITVSGTSGTGVSAAPAASSTTVLQPITRAPVVAAKLPTTPTISVPLYPDPTRWYNRLGDVIVLWNVPADVTRVAATLDHVKSNSTAPAPETTLSNGKDFGTLQDGIWYVTAWFKNNVGWGSPSYYEIAIDTTAPLPFTARVENAGTDNPSPTIQFQTSDSLSGIAGYTIAVDGTVVATTTATTLTLPPQSPGTHTLVVSANDLAGNSAQDTTSFQILPLPTPRITFLGTSISQGGSAFVSGDGTPSSSINAVVLDGSKREVFSGTSPVDASGHWEISVDVPLAAGKYYFSATAHNERGAQSAASAEQSFTITAPSIISFGFIDLGWFGILIIVILLATTGASLWLWRNIARKQKRGLYNIVAGRDVEKLSTLLSSNIDELARLPSLKGAMDDPELTHLIATMKQNVEKIRKNIKLELEKLK